MNIEVFALCDAATDAEGKLNILGAFDTIAGPVEPVVISHCAIALRMRFKRIEAGAHQVRIGLVDADGRAVIPAFQTTMNIQVREPQESAVANLILNLANVSLGSAGRYSADLAVDGRQEGSLPFYVRRITNPTVEQRDK